MNQQKKNDKPSLWKSIRTGLYFALAIGFIAYAFQVTRIDLTEFRKPTRVTSWTRALRALAKPEIFEYEKAETIVNAPIYVPCPEGVTPSLAEQDTSEPYLLIPTCGAPGEIITVEGFNFPPGAVGPIGWVPSSDPAYDLLLRPEDVKVDSEGHFSYEFTLPTDRLSADVQHIRVVARQNVGAPMWSENAKLTWEKIIETVFMAFLATLLGTILSFPISFLAARNLMVNVKSPLTSMAMSIIGWPVGILAGGLLARWMLKLSSIEFGGVWMDIASVAVGGGIVWLLLRWSLLNADENALPLKRFLRIAALIVAAFLLVFVLYDFTSLGIRLGQSLLPEPDPLSESLQPETGPFTFLANFIYQASDIMHTIMVVIVALVAGGVASSLLGRIGQRTNERLSPIPLRIVNALLAGIAFAMLFMLIGAGIDWLYQVQNITQIYIIPGAVGGVLGILLAVLTKPKSSLPIGLVVYFIMRTILNAVRSVEAVIMAIVFVIFVGVGPFAGVMALGLHTIASLAKLYSEQVESILPGPLEAIQATGANRLQTIVYGVIPQIIPPYISYTMYRWDINVRMSTIIGLTGGGGIGFLLVQNINLLNYRAASTQMLAIAVVVASMDYISSKLREKTV
jgi:phosphonate ABC transporter permease subunit PhnE